MKDFEFEEICSARRFQRFHEIAAMRARLKRLEPEDNKRFEFLQSRWNILSSQGSWEQCECVAVDMIAEDGDESYGWLYLAEAVKHAPGGTLQMAYGILRSAAAKSHNALLFFALAQYAIELGNEADARKWLVRAKKEAD